MRVKRRLIASLAGCSLARSRNRPESPPRDFIRLLRLDPMSSSKGLLPGGPDHPMAWPMKVRSGSNDSVPRREREGLQSAQPCRSRAFQRRSRYHSICRPSSGVSRTATHAVASRLLGDGGPPRHDLSRHQRQLPDRGDCRGARGFVIDAEAPDLGPGQIVDNARLALTDEETFAPLDLLVDTIEADRDPMFAARQGVAPDPRQARRSGRAATRPRADSALRRRRFFGARGAAEMHR